MTPWTTVPLHPRRRVAAGLRVAAVLLPLIGAATAHADTARVPGDHGGLTIYEPGAPTASGAPTTWRTAPPGGPSGVTAPPGGPSGVTAPPGGPSGVTAPPGGPRRTTEPGDPAASDGVLAHTGGGELAVLGLVGTVLIIGGAAAAKLGRRPRRH